MTTTILRSPDFDPVADVEEFHTKFGINYTGLPRELPAELANFRLKFLREELVELETCYDSLSFEIDKLNRPERHRFTRSIVTQDLAQALDAIADLVYVALGTAHLHGFDFREAWRRVHAANMRKVHAANMRKVHPAAPAASPEERVKMKIIKPPGWEPPDHKDLVAHHIHGAEPQP